MRLPRVRFTIGSLMIVVAVAGMLSALLRIPEVAVVAVAAVLIVSPPSIACLLPFLTRPGRRLFAATWVAALWPLWIPWTLHAAWGVAYGFLGYSPGPIDNGSVIDLLGVSVFISIAISLFSPVVSLSIVFLVIAQMTSAKGRRRVWLIPVLAMPLVWYSVYLILRWDPLKAGEWFMD